MKRKPNQMVDFPSVGELTQNRFENTVTFILNHQNPNPSIEGQHFPPDYRFVMEDLIYDQTTNPDTKRPWGQRLIRYIPGETSIFVDEQSEIAQKNTKKEYCEFSKRGEKIVDKRENLFLEFMIRSNFNGSNPNRNPDIRPVYWELNMAKGLDEMMAKDEVLSTVKTWCYKAPWEDVKSYARVLNLDINRDPSEVRWSMKILAEQNPDKFSKGMNNPATKRKHYVIEALDRGILTRNVPQNALMWAGGGALFSAAIGRDVVDDFVDATFKNDSNLSLINSVIYQLYPNPEVEAIFERAKQSNWVSESGEVSANGLNDNQLRGAINNAVMDGILIKKGPVWIEYKNTMYKGADDLIRAFKADEMLFKAFHQDCGNPATTKEKIPVSS